MKNLFKFLFLFIFSISNGQNQTFTGVKTFTTPPKFNNVPVNNSAVKVLALNPSTNSLEYILKSTISPTPGLSDVLAVGSSASAGPNSILLQPINLTLFDSGTSQLSGMESNGCFYGMSYGPYFIKEDFEIPTLDRIQIRPDESGTLATREWVTANVSGGGAVDSVNGEVGVVILDTGDILEVTDNNYVTDANLTKINAIDQAVSSAEKSTWNAKQSALTFDSTPTDGSTNPVTSNGIYDYIETLPKKAIYQLTSDLSNATTTDSNITGFTYTVPAGKFVEFTAILPFESAATSTGIGVGVQLVTNVGANNNVLGSIKTESRLSSTTVGIVVNPVDLGANATVSYDSLSGVSTAGVSNVVTVTGILKNLATNTDATVQLIFRSEVASSTVTLKKGASLAVDTK